MRLGPQTKHKFQMKALVVSTAQRALIDVMKEEALRLRVALDGAPCILSGRANKKMALTRLTKLCLLREALEELMNAEPIKEQHR